MQNLSDGLLLYHGSYTPVEKPDIARCAKFKDFGQGFYLTTSYQQACDFARLTLRKAKANGTAETTQQDAFVSRYLFSESEEPLSVHMFQSADEAWLHCVAAHRKEGLFPGLVEELSSYDVLIGKIANDQTNATLVNYMAEAFGPLGSPQADQICVSLLLPERLTDQFCFRTPRSLSHLEFQGAERV